MSTIKKLIISLVFISIISMFVSYQYLTGSEIDFNCSSNFERNSHKDHSLFFNGSFDFALNKNGRGNMVLTINGVYKKPFTVFRTYNFEYYFDSNNRMFTKLKNYKVNHADNVSDDFMKQYLFDLSFDSDGQMKVYKEDNVLYFFSPKMLVTTCASTYKNESN